MGNHNNKRNRGFMEKLNLIVTLQEERKLLVNQISATKSKLSLFESWLIDLDKQLKILTDEMNKTPKK